MSTGQMPPGPYDRPPVGPPDPVRPPATDRPAGSRLPVLFSGLALIVALVAAGVSLVALSRTGDQPQPPPPATAPSTAAPSIVVTTPAPPTDATDTTTPTTDPPTGVPDPHGVYTPVYQQKVLRLQPSNQRYIDLDKPSADGGSDRGEFLYTDSYTPPKLQFGQVAVAKLTNSDGQAGDCAEQLDAAPIDGLFTPAKGDLICVLTDANKAVNQGISRKLALLRVDAIAPDGTMNLTITAWDVPS